MDNNCLKEYVLETNPTYHKGQRVFYQGDEAMILDVSPVLTIKIKDKNKVICGDALLKAVNLK